MQYLSVLYVINLKHFHEKPLILCHSGTLCVEFREKDEFIELELDCKVTDVGRRLDPWSVGHSSLTAGPEKTLYMLYISVEVVYEY